MLNFTTSNVSFKASFYTNGNLKKDTFKDCLAANRCPESTLDELIEFKDELAEVAASQEAKGDIVKFFYYPYDNWTDVKKPTIKIHVQTNYPVEHYKDFNFVGKKGLERLFKNKDRILGYIKGMLESSEISKNAGHDEKEIL